MIVVRNVFKLKFGKAREALELWKEGLGYMNEAGLHNERVLTDLTGQFYTVVFETTYDDLTDYEKTAGNETRSDDWRKWYQKFSELVDSGYREIFKIADTARPDRTHEKAYARSRA